MREARTGSMRGLESRPISSAISSEFIKRALDITVATLVFLILMPVMLLTAIAVAVSSRGPVLFRQDRLGRDQKTFVMLKFRTMVDGSDDAIHRDFVASMFGNGNQDAGEIYKLTEDPRVTRVGRILRRFSFDELPQLFNVIAGDMSLVGPRPALPWEVGLFEARHLTRFLVKPGITGLWQVSGRSILTMPQALDLDAEYVSRRSIALDVKILLRTLPAVITGRGAS